jgi:hypothetical protein
MTWKHLLAGLCGFGFGFWLFMPRDAVLLPRYEVLLEDASGKGFPLAEVREFRQDYVISGVTSSSIATADSYGRAAFPVVHGRTSPLRRLIVCGRLMAAHGVHTPCGYLHQIAVEVPGYAETSRTESELPLKGRGRLIHITMRATGPKP